MQLYNTLEKTKQELAANDPISIYTCGPTVYLDPHIGNWRTFIFYDTLIRALQLEGHDTKHVLNITDVGHLVSDGDTGEDKMSKTAKSMRKTAWEVADHYTNIFLAGLKELHLLKPTKLAKATDHIPEQIAMVQAIEDAGYAYIIRDGVYFDTAKLADYGKLAGGVSADEDFARINQNDEKRSPEDFALWKFSPKGEKRDMEWDSPWGVGFPGWHLECSAMAKTYLGETIDIHAGGVDHIPVHHTNEIAQSETANGVQFANVWLHAEFMKVDGAKMSKSKGNFFTLDDISKKGFDPLSFRMLILQGHYRTETNFTWDNLQHAANALRNLRQSYERVYSPIESADDITQQVEDAQLAFTDAIADDVNTPKALSILNKVANMVDGGIAPESRQAFIAFFQLADKALGLAIVEDSQDITDEQKTMITKRLQAKTQKNYAEADKLRTKLDALGIEVLDSAEGAIWQRK